jgi:hypothetical protein
VQTFLPYADFRSCAEVLDSPRLGKQRVETLQILRALVLPDYGWQNHPAVRMWRGRTEALVRYGLDCVESWQGRGHSDSTAHQIAEFAPPVLEQSQDDLRQAGLLPSWLGDERLHVSHRSRLIAKDPDFYRPRFPGTVEGLDYFWPEPDASHSPVQPGTGARLLWVLRPETEQALGRSLLTGVVGLGASTGVGVDATGLDLAGLRAVHDTPSRRPSRGLRALADFVTLIEPGNELGVLVGAGTALLVGVVTGPYHFVPRDSFGPQHRRTVRWDRLVARSAVGLPASLQDVRPLFSVAWGP